MYVTYHSWGVVGVEFWCEIACSGVEIATYDGGELGLRAI